MNYILAPLRWLDRNAERTLILFAYSAMALIIVYAVFERFVFKTQIPWSSSIPIYLFLWVTWIGCSHNVRKRTHLNFNDLRTRMPYGAQFACMCLDGSPRSICARKSALSTFAGFSCMIRLKLCSRSGIGTREWRT